MSNPLSAEKPRAKVLGLSPSRAVVAGIGTALPPFCWSQRDVLKALAGASDFYKLWGVEQLFANSAIETRYFAVSPQDYNAHVSAGEQHQLFLENAPKLARKAAQNALASAGLKAQDIDFVVVATCTGYVCPGLSVHLMNDLKMSESAQRADLAGMGCAGAMPALQRGFDFVRGRSGKRALVVAVEICSACLYLDESLETVVGNAICGDGAAAVILEGIGEDAKVDQPIRTPEILDFETVVDTDWMSSVGLENVEGKQRIILSKELRHAAGPAVKKVVDRLLQRYELEAVDICHWVFHAGGAAVLANIDEAMDFHDGELTCSRDVFEKHGNMSSPTTLFVLKEIQETQQPKAGDLGVALALGPGLATEAALLRW